MATTITMTVADDASPFRVTLTPRQGFNPLFQINDGPQFDAAWMTELINLLNEAKALAKPDESHKSTSPSFQGKKKHAPKM